MWSPQQEINMHIQNYMQFSTFDHGTNQYQPPIDIPTRSLLHRALYTQKNFRDVKQRWTENLVGLGLTKTRHKSFVDVPCFVISNDHFKASIEIRTKEGKT